MNESKTLVVVRTAQLRTSHEPGREQHARHQTLTIVLHWTTVSLVLAQYALAIFHEVSGGKLRRDLLMAHRSLGIIVLLLVVGRLAWRLLGMRLLPFPSTMSRWQQWGARLSEWGLYGLMLAQPLTGILATVLQGRPFSLFGIRVQPLMAPAKAWAATADHLHTLGAYTLATLVAVHAGAAILHRMIANDGVLDSMLPKLRAKRRGASVALYSAPDSK